MGVDRSPARRGRWRRLPCCRRGAAAAAPSAVGAGVSSGSRPRPVARRRRGRHGGVFGCAGSGLRPWLLGVLAHVDPPEGDVARPHRCTVGVARPGGSRSPADVLTPCYGMPIAARHRAGAPGEVACPPHVTPHRHRIDEPDGRRVMDLARRRRAPAQGHRRGGSGAARRGGRRRAAGRRRSRPRGHRDPVAHRGEAGPLAREDGRPHRGQGHAEASARRVGHPGAGLGQAAP